MNQTAISHNSSDHSWSRRTSIETIFSVQDQETDFARDTSDTEAASDEGEYEPVTEPEDEDEAPVDENTSTESDNDIISTRVISVCVGDSGDLVFADSERTDDTHSDSDIDYNDYWNCAQCKAVNDSPTYRYCQKCFQVRKSFFPPRPRRKHKRGRTAEPVLPYKRARRINPDSPAAGSQEAGSQEAEGPRALSQDSGVETSSQGTSHDYDVSSCKAQKRRAESLDRSSKRSKYSDSSDSDNEVIPLAKSISDPSVAIESVNVTKKVIANTLKEIDSKELCMVCDMEPKSGVFVHGRLAHICCCYKCAVKVWVRTKRCPICKRQISNVLRAVVM